MSTRSDALQQFDANTEVVLCGEAAADTNPAGAQSVLRLQNGEAGRNVYLHIEQISNSLATDVPPQLVDLVEIATFVYVADQAHTRGGAGVEDMGANWRRSLHFEIPVRCLDFWQSSEVMTALRDVLSFLSEDEYSFRFRPYQSPPPFEGYLNFAQYDWVGKPERVVLFSGGLDSLAGAVKDIVVERRQVALVTHRSSGKFINRLRMIRQLLDAKANGHRPLHVDVTINKDENLSREYTQRSRSFLYACLGMTIARMYGLDELRFYENGTVSLNLPISRQVVGAKATRTTHPRVLAGFRHLFSLVAGQPFKVTNEFMWKTKGEVVDLIVQAGCGGMIEWSSSCTHVWELSNAKPHCGTCSQCIDRRFAVLAADAGAYERADTYGVDLLVDPRDEGESRTMLASYVETAQLVAGMSEMEFFGQFGEVARVVRQLDGTADENARRVYELYRRHAHEVIKVIEAGLAQNVSRIMARSLPESCLLRLVHDPGVPQELAASAESSNTAVAAARPTEPDYFLRQRGQKWELRFAGHEPQILNAAIGYIYLRELLRFPEKRFTVSQLLVAVHGDKAVLPTGIGESSSDALAKKAYAERLHELEQELEDAQEFNDVGRVEQLAEEKEKLLVGFRNAGFRRMARRHNKDLNNIRNSVCNAIKRVVDTIGKYDTNAYEHLSESIRRGYSVVYQPKTPVSWTF